MIRLQCPNCDKSLRIDDALAGRAGRCPGCGYQFQIPSQPPVAEAIRSPRLGEPSSAPADKEAPLEFLEPVPLSKPRSRRLPRSEPEKPPLSLVDDQDPEQLKKLRRKQKKLLEQQEDDYRWLQEEERRERKRQRRRDPDRAIIGIAGFLTIMLGLGILGMLLIVLTLFVPAFSIVAMLMGGLIGFAGACWLWSVALDEGVIQLLLVMLVPFYVVVFLVLHFDRAAKPFFMNLLGAVIFTVGWFAALGHAAKYELEHQPTATQSNPAPGNLPSAPGVNQPGFSPQPTNPFPMNPQPNNPFPTNPQPFNPFPTNPQPNNPFPGNPQPFNPFPTNPQPNNPFPGNQQPFNPFPGNRQPNNPFPMNPRPSNPRFPSR